MSRSMIFAAALALVAFAAHAATPPAKGAVDPDWLRKPSYEDLKAAWPRELTGDGSAVIHCRVNIRGLLENCVVRSETPAGKGVGGAALLLAPNFQMKPAMRDGQPTEGSVNIPIRFTADGYTGTMGGERVNVLLHPLWLQGPTAAEVTAAAPSGLTQIGHATIRCDVRPTGELHACETLVQNPPHKGLGEAAKRLAPRFRVYVDPAFKHVQVTVPVTFEPASTEPRYITAPDWRLKPTGDQAIAVYPDKAAKDGIRTGRAVVECQVKADGSFEACRADSEEPAGEDFGVAATRLAGFMAIGAWTQGGRPVDGAHIRIPIRLKFADPAPAQPEPKKQP